MTQFLADLTIWERIWPGRGVPLEEFFRQEMIQALKAIEPTYADWMVSVNYGVESYIAPQRSRCRRATRSTS